MDSLGYSNVGLMILIPIIHSRDKGRMEWNYVDNPIIDNAMTPSIRKLCFIFIVLGVVTSEEMHQLSYN